MVYTKITTLPDVMEERQGMLKMYPDTFEPYIEFKGYNFQLEAVING